MHSKLLVVLLRLRRALAVESRLALSCTHLPGLQVSTTMHRQNPVLDSEI